MTLPRGEEGDPVPVASGFAPWWGTHQLQEGGTGYLRVGPLRVWLCRLPTEWRITTLSGDDPHDTHLVPLTTPADGLAESVPPHADIVRFGFARAPEAITWVPRLADRAVVVRPDRPFALASGESVQLYVSSPAWLRFSFGSNDSAHHELPIFRPSDTWFGPHTREGELCYASRSLLRLSASEVEVRPHRVVTELLVRNRGNDSLHVDRLRLPVEHLSVYADGEGRLWTERVTLVREHEKDFAAVRIGEGPPPEAKRPERVSSARRDAGPNLVVRAFQAIFSD